jgi:hypothetical protein
MPRIQLTPGVKFTLYGLRIYLLVMLVLILVKFLGIVNPAGSPQPRQSGATQSVR